MSLYDYRESQSIAGHNFSFYALIMAAMRQADTTNATALRIAFPNIWRELSARYNAPAGVLPGEFAPEDDDSMPSDLGIPSDL